MINTQHSEEPLEQRVGQPDTRDTAAKFIILNWGNDLGLGHGQTIEIVRQCADETNYLAGSQYANQKTPEEWWDFTNRGNLGEPSFSQEVHGLVQTLEDMGLVRHGQARSDKRFQAPQGRAKYPDRVTDPNDYESARMLPVWAIEVSIPTGGMQTGATSYMATMFAGGIGHVDGLINQHTRVIHSSRSDDQSELFVEQNYGVAKDVAALIVHDKFKGHARVVYGEIPLPITERAIVVDMTSDKTRREGYDTVRSEIDSVLSLAEGSKDGEGRYKGQLQLMLGDQLRSQGHAHPAQEIANETRGYIPIDQIRALCTSFLQKLETEMHDRWRYHESGEPLPASAKRFVADKLEVTIRAFPD